MSNSLPTVTVLIVNYNSGAYAVACIDSLLQQQGVVLDVVVVDNASQDNSVAQLQSWQAVSKQSSQVCLIQSETNLGFGRANNLAATKATGEYLLLLNPDTELHQTDIVKALIDKLIDHSNLGLIAPLIDEPRKNKQVLARYRYPEQKALKHTQTLANLPGTIAWVLGACMLTKRHIYEAIGGFDEDYFLYGEDIDICLRIRLAGYAIGFASEIQVMHVGGASEAGAESYGKWLRKRRGKFLFFTKHYHALDRQALAKSIILKTRLYLTIHKLRGWLTPTPALVYQDKTHRLNATITAAQEMLALSRI